jgi:hypothetical protein
MSLSKAPFIPFPLGLKIEIFFASLGSIVKRYMNQEGGRTYCLMYFPHVLHALIPFILDFPNESEIK